MPRRSCKKDANHDELSEHARELGWHVLDTFQFAQYVHGFPDAVWVKDKRVVLAEYKTEDGRLTKDEKEFQEEWPGEYYVLYNKEDVEAV